MMRRTLAVLALAALLLVSCGGSATSGSSAAPVSGGAPGSPPAPSGESRSAAGGAAAAGSASAGAAAKPASSTGATSASANPGALTIAYVAPADSFLWEMTAYKQGLFQKNGVAVNQPVFVGGTPRLGTALLAGNFDAAGVGFPAAVDADVTGADLEAVASLSKYAAFSVVVPLGSPIKTPKDLKGKTVALSQIGDTADAFLTTLLAKNGMNRATDVNVTQAGSTKNALAQVLAKQVDAAAVGNADAATGKAQGAIVLVNSKQLGQLQPQGPLLVRKSWAAGHKPQLLGLLKGMMEANAAYRSSQDVGIKQLQDSGWFNDVPRDVLAAIWKDDLDSWSDVPFVDDEAAKTVIQLEATQNKAIAQEQSTALYDNSYLQELVDSGFVKTLPAKAS